MMLEMLTLLDIMIVSSALLCELKATFSVFAWNSTRIVWKTEEGQEFKRTSIHWSVFDHQFIAFHYYSWANDHLSMNKYNQKATPAITNSHEKLEE